MQVEEGDEESGSPKVVLATLGIVMLVLGGALVSVFVFRLQPPYVPPSVAPSSESGVANIIMPPGVGDNPSLDFTPTNATIVIGVNNTVVWTNLDTSTHTVVSKDVPSGAASFSSPLIAKGATFNVTLTVAGTYRYYCTLHPAWMQAVLVVKTALSGGQHSAGVAVAIPAEAGTSTSLSYSPATTTMVLGVNATATLVNQDNAKHTVAATDNSFSSGDINAGSSFTRTSTSPGTFAYSCIYHA